MNGARMRMFLYRRRPVRRDADRVAAALGNLERALRKQAERAHKAEGWTLRDYLGTAATRVFEAIRVIERGIELDKGGR